MKNIELSKEVRASVSKLSDSDKKELEKSFFNDWKPDYNLTPRIIVCAAIKKGDRIITGARHYDKIMRQQIIASEGIDFWKAGTEQGFIDQFGDFLNRNDAWIVAENQKQIRKQVSTPGTLFSENIY